MGPHSDLDVAFLPYVSCRQIESLLIVGSCCDSRSDHSKYARLLHQDSNHGLCASLCDGFCLWDKTAHARFIAFADMFACSRCKLVSGSANLFCLRQFQATASIRAPAHLGFCAKHNRFWFTAHAPVHVQLVWTWLSGARLLVCLMD